MLKLNSNTTLVKVKSIVADKDLSWLKDSNTTLVKVKSRQDKRPIMSDIRFKYNTC